MNFLEIVQMAARESMVMEPGTPDTVVGQSGLAANFVAWVADSYDTLQLKRPRWDWMRRTITSNPLTINVAAYSAAALGITSFGRWIQDYDDSSGSTYFPVSIYSVANGVAFESPLPFMKWEMFRQKYLRGTVAASSPQNWSIKPDTQELVVGPAPSAPMILNIEHVKGKQDRLALDATVPELPVEHHPLLAYLGLLRAQNGDQASPMAVQVAKDYVAEHLNILDREENVGFSIGSDPIA